METGCWHSLNETHRTAVFEAPVLGLSVSSGAFLPARESRMRSLLTAALALVFLSGCGIIYRANVYQGNLLEQQAVEQLKAGLTKRQVLILLGSPSVEDSFNHERWDYFASFKRGRGETDVKNLTLYFDGDLLSRWEGDYFPELDLALTKEMGRYGNLPRDKDKEQQRRGR